MHVSSTLVVGVYVVSVGGYVVGNGIGRYVIHLHIHVYVVSVGGYMVGNGIGRHVHIHVYVVCVSSRCICGVGGWVGGR